MYFDIISQATHDSGLAVRKRATKILWACVQQCGDAFPRRADAITQVRQADVRNIVARDVKLKNLQENVVS